VISELPKQSSWSNNLVTTTLTLLDLNANSRVSINGAEDLVFDSKRSHEFFESSEFVKRAGKLIKENEVS